MQKRLGQASDRVKPHGLPELNGSEVDADNKVELHGFVTTCAGVLQRVSAHVFGYATASDRRFCHEAAVAHVLPAACLVGLDVVGANHLTIFFSHECFFVGTGPVSDGIGCRHLGIERIGGAIANRGQNDFENGFSIRGVGFSY